MNKAEKMSFIQDPREISYEKNAVILVYGICDFSLDYSSVFFPYLVLECVSFGWGVTVMWGTIRS